MTTKCHPCVPLAIGLSLVLAIGSVGLAAGQLPLEQAWEQLPSYAYGADQAGLLAIEREVIDVMQTPSRRAEVAARLARVLDDPAATLAARQFACLQLRQVGTPAEVPILARWLSAAETSDMARAALAAIPGPASLDALRAALPTLQEASLVGVINTLGVRRDNASVSPLIALTRRPQAAVREAAVRALANIADPVAIAHLRDRAAAGGEPWVRDLAQGLAHAAAVLADDGDRDGAAAIYRELAAAGQRPEMRAVALEGLLRLETAGREETIRRWLVSQDAIERRVAAGHLATLPDAALDQLAGDLGALPETSGEALLDVLTRRRHEQLQPWALQLIRSGQPAEQLLGLRCLASVQDADIVPLLIDCLGGEAEVAAAAREVLARQPRAEVGQGLLAALPQARPAHSKQIIALLGELRLYEAIDPLVALAEQADPAVFGPALDGLRSIADPDEPDLTRLLELLRRARPGEQRDAVEKTIAAVCEKLPADADRGQLVVQLLGDAQPAGWQLCLPLLGRIGGPAAWGVLEPFLADPDPAVADAAIRGLCNWPTAEVADRLWAVATEAGDARQRRRALRSFVRVISLPSDRAPDTTLARLQAAMEQASQPDDRALILRRAAGVRTMDCVRWVAGYLGDAALAQTACATLVALAHHRELRHPNLEEFRPLLERIATLSTDATIAERARRYQLGL